MQPIEPFREFGIKSSFNLASYSIGPPSSFYVGSAEYIPPRSIQEITPAFFAGFSVGCNYRGTQISLASQQAVELIEEGPPPLAVFVLQREDDGEYLFANSIGITSSLGASAQEAVLQWFESARELHVSLASERGSIGTPALSKRLEALDATLG